MWLLSLLYVWFFLNHTHAGLINDIPITKDTGSTAEIIPLFRFRFWQQLYYKVDNYGFPSYSTEKHGCWVGISKHVGNYMTFKVLTYDT